MLQKRAALPEVSPDVARLMRERHLDRAAAEAALPQAWPTHDPDSHEIRMLTRLKEIRDAGIFLEPARVARALGPTTYTVRPSGGCQPSHLPTFTLLANGYGLAYTFVYGGCRDANSGQVRDGAAAASASLYVRATTKDFCITGPDTMSVFPAAGNKTRTDGITVLVASGDHAGAEYPVVYADPVSPRPYPSLRNTQECLVIRMADGVAGG